ncbi:unnamed protein product [Bemisia tabaci]|uniref:Ionotropic receptor n=1 Tax=Bemisia tabaci TaxID=7038 RepID=A0A9P0FAQ0_BEMTA|nr:unnamed protein product [Bemisia tabaci]
MSLFGCKYYSLLTILCFWPREVALLPHSSTHALKNHINLLTKICPLVLERSKHKLIHVTTIHPEFDSTALIHNLHNALIPTLHANSVQPMGPQFIETEPKTMLFILDNFNNILNLILGSQNFGKVDTAATSFRVPKNASESLVGEQEAFNLPTFCIHLEVELKLIFMNPTSPCDENFTISDIQLQEDSHLSESLFDQVRGLSQNNVWNSRNYLIFYVASAFQVPQILEENSHGAVDRIYSLRYVFRFMWRMFKGQKTLICLREACYRYDPFFEKIQEYVKGGEDVFFDFSWHSMNDKPLTYSMVDLEPFSLDYGLKDYCAANTVVPFLIAILHVAASRNCRLHQFSDDVHFIKDPFSSLDTLTHLEHLELGLKYGVDLHVTGIGLGNLANLRDFDVTPTTESCQLTFRLPRKGYVPQDVVPFYSFSLTVWIFITVTLLIFALVHYTLVITYINMFCRSDAGESMLGHELFPTLMTIYRYALGIGQPRLIMVELMVGKIVFLIVVFSMMILITLFQSGMFSLLSSRVRYRDIDTFKDIEDSEFVLQSSCIEIDAQFLGDESEFGWIRQKLTDSFKFICEKYYTLSLFIDDDDDILLNETLIDTDEKNLVTREVDAMLKSDAFLTRMSTKYTELNDLVYKHHSTKKEYEFHIARERLLSYPFMYFMPRNGFYREVLNDALFRLMETGILYLEIAETTPVDFSKYRARENDDEARPFTLTDLRLAFFLLFIGWALAENVLSHNYLLPQRRQHHFFKLKNFFVCKRSDFSGHLIMTRFPPDPPGSNQVNPPDFGAI